MATGRFVITGLALLALGGGEAARAQCMVEDAAQAALQRELEVVKALAADPADSFKGAEGCVNFDILDSLDLSFLIPDLAGMITSFGMDAINGIIASAQDQVCRQIQTAMNDSIGDVTSAVSDFNSGLTGDLSEILDNGWQGLVPELDVDDLEIPG